MPGTTSTTPCTTSVAPWIIPVRNAVYQKYPKIFISFRAQNEAVNTTPTAVGNLYMRITYDIRVNYTVKKQSRFWPT